MSRNGFVGEHEEAVSVLDIDRLGEVADQEVEQPLDVDVGILLADDAFERRPRRADADIERTALQL